MTTTVDQQVIELEKRFWRTIMDRDVDAALALTDDPCIIAGASGTAIVDHASFRQIMSAATYTLHDFAIEDAKVRMLSGDVALVAYKVREDLTVDGQKLTLNAADSSVWVRRNGDWRCAMHTESVLGDSYGRDRKPTS
jgi:hypothetical protein